MRLLHVLLGMWLSVGWVLQVHGGASAECRISGRYSGARPAMVRIAGVQVPLDASGCFHYSVASAQPTFVTMTGGPTLDLYLVPGKTLHLTVSDPAHPQGIAFTGELGEINRCWTGVHAALEAETRDLSQNARQLYTPDTTAFLAGIDRRFAPLLARLGLVTAKSDMVRNFITDARTRLQFVRANLLLEYPPAVRYFTGDGSFQPPAGYYDFVERLPINDSRALRSTDFRTFIDSWVTLDAEAHPPKPQGPPRAFFPTIWNQLRVILATISDPAIRDFLLQKRLARLLDEHEYKHCGEVAAELARHCRNRTELERSIAAARGAEQKLEQGVVRKVYKTIGNVSLEVFLYLPAGWRPEDRRGAVAFFHGGGWTIGATHWGDEDCRYFAQRGLVAMSFEYRLISVHGTTPVESMRDAHSALRWVRRRAGELGVDPERIAAMGFSAGGHLAAATAPGLTGFDEPDEDATIPSTSDAMLLWSAPVRFTSDSDYWFISQLRGRAEFLACSPFDHLRQGHPPVMMAQGAADTLVSPTFAQEYADRLKSLGTRCELLLYEGQDHLPWPAARRTEVLEKMATFLTSLGFMAQKPPTPSGM